AASNYTTITAATQIDLSPYYLTAPASTTAGTAMNITIGVGEYNSSPTGTYTVGIYASSDSNITTSDVLLKTISRPSISGYSSDFWTEAVTVPSWLTGSYVIGVIT